MLFSLNFVRGTLNKKFFENFVKIRLCEKKTQSTASNVDVYFKTLSLAFKKSLVFFSMI